MMTIREAATLLRGLPQKRERMGNVKLMTLQRIVAGEVVRGCARICSGPRPPGLQVFEGVGLEREREVLENFEFKFPPKLTQPGVRLRMKWDYDNDEYIPEESKYRSSLSLGERRFFSCDGYVIVIRDFWNEPLGLHGNWAYFSLSNPSPDCIIAGTYCVGPAQDFFSEITIDGLKRWLRGSVMRPVNVLHVSNGYLQNILLNRGVLISEDHVKLMKELVFPSIEIENGVVYVNGRSARLKTEEVSRIARSIPNPDHKGDNSASFSRRRGIDKAVHIKP